MASLDIEVKTGETVDVTVCKGKAFFLKKVYLPENRDTTEEWFHWEIITADGKKFVGGWLHPLRQPQDDSELGFDKSFKLTHASKSHSVYFSGMEGDNDTDYDEEDEGITVTVISTDRVDDIGE